MVYHLSHDAHFKRGRSYTKLGDYVTSNSSILVFLHLLLWNAHINKISLPKHFVETMNDLVFTSHLKAHDRTNFSFKFY